MLHNSTLPNGTIKNSMLQNRTALQNNTVTKRYIVMQWYILQNSTLQYIQSGTQTLWYVTSFGGVMLIVTDHIQDKVGPC
jgi:hypothetical protein